MSQRETKNLIFIELNVSLISLMMIDQSPQNILDDRWWIRQLFLIAIIINWEHLLPIPTPCTEKEEQKTVKSTGRILHVL